MEEIWDLVDENGERTGVLYKRGCGEPIPAGLRFSVVEIWVKVGERVLITQRHPDKWAGLLWEVSGGGVQACESSRRAAVRELSEETGITVSEDRLTHLGRLIKQDVMVDSYFISLDDLPGLTLQASEVVDARLVTYREMEMMKPELTRGTSERFDLYGCGIFGIKQVNDN